MSSRSQNSLARVNWYLQSSLKHMTEWISDNSFYYRGGCYRQVSLYLCQTRVRIWHRTQRYVFVSWIKFRMTVVIELMYLIYYMISSLCLAGTHSMRWKQYGQYFADNIIIYVSLNKNYCPSIEIPMLIVMPLPALHNQLWHHQHNIYKLNEAKCRCEKLLFWLLFTGSSYQWMFNECTVMANCLCNKQKGYFDVYFTTWIINTKIILSWAHKQLTTQAHTLSSMYCVRSKFDMCSTGKKSSCQIF